MIFYGIVGPTRQKFSNESPLISKSEYRVALLFVSLNNDLIFVFVPTLFAYLRVEVVVPSLSALFSDSPRQLFGDVTPILRTVLLYQSQNQLIFFLGLTRSNCTQGPLTRFGLRTFCQRCKHCTSVLSSKNEAIFFQFLAPYSSTNCCNFSSS